jgi:hypothetical protein
MPICSTFYKPPVAREEAVNLFISAVQAAPESFPKLSSAEEFAEAITKGAQKLLDYIKPAELNKPD